MYTIPHFPTDFTGASEDSRAAQLRIHFPHRNRPLHGSFPVWLARIPLLILFLSYWIPYFLAFFLISRPYAYQNLFVAGMQGIYTTTIHSLLISLILLFIPRSAFFAYLSIYLILYTALYILFSPLLLTFFKHIFLKYHSLPLLSFWKYCAFLPILLSLYTGFLSLEDSPLPPCLFSSPHHPRPVWRLHCHHPLHEHEAHGPASRLTASESPVVFPNGCPDLFKDHQQRTRPDPATAVDEEPSHQYGHHTGPRKAETGRCIHHGRPAFSLVPAL